MRKFCELCLVILAVAGSGSVTSSLSSPVSCSNSNTACAEEAGDLLDITTGVLSKEQCREVCLASADCNYFTYYDLHSSPLREACLNVSECSDCLSESNYCKICGEAASGRDSRGPRGVSLWRSD